MYNKTKEPTDDAVALANLLICILGGGGEFVKPSILFFTDTFEKISE